MLISSILSLAIVVTGQQKIDPAMLLGTWEHAHPERATIGRTLIFAGDGKLVSIPKDDGAQFPGKYTVKGDTVTISPGEFALTIKELDKNKLVLEGFGGVNEFKRKGAGGMARNAPKAGGFRVGAMPKSRGNWVVVNSDKGDFSVQMPGQPNMRSNGGGGGFETSELGHQTSRVMDLIVAGIYGPTEVPTENRAKVLAQIRDQFVGKYGRDLKVVSEKAVQVGGLEGQEFVVSLDRMGAGPMTMRGRVCAQGKSAYLLLAMPMLKGQSLGPDAQKFLESFALKGSSGGEMASAKPAGKSASRPSSKAAAKKSAVSASRAWGREVDPDSDVRIRASGSALSIEIPATAHVLAPEREKMNAPRVLAPIEGDFVATVQVSGAFQPERRSTVKGLSSRQAGGLIIWKNARNYLVLQRRATIDDGKVANQAVLEELTSGSKGVTHRHPSTAAATYLRLERKGGRIMAAFSEDGNEWNLLKPVDTDWAVGEVQVGVVAVNTSASPHSVRFEDYSLKSK